MLLRVPPHVALQTVHVGGGKITATAAGRRKKQRVRTRQSSQFNKLHSEVNALLLYTCSLKGDKGFTAKQRGNCHFKKKNKSLFSTIGHCGCSGWKMRLAFVVAWRQILCCPRSTNRALHLTRGHLYIIKTK